MSNYLWNEERLKVVRVIDGDTIKFIFDMGFNVFSEQTIRLARVNTPELRSKDPKERERANEAKQFVIDVLTNSKTIKAVTYKAGKYGRYLCDVWYDGHHLNKVLLEKGHAKPYDQNKKRVKRDNR